MPTDGAMGEEKSMGAFLSSHTAGQAQERVSGLFESGEQWERAAIPIYSMPHSTPILIAHAALHCTSMHSQVRPPGRIEGRPPETAAAGRLTAAQRVAEASWTVEESTAHSGPAVCSLADRVPCECE